MQANKQCVIFLLGLMCVATVARAADSHEYQVVDGVAIYFGVLPAELVRGHPREHPESEMHGGIAVGDSHLLVGLFDQHSGQRIGGAQIVARVTSASGMEVSKPLESMVIGGSASFGNYFPLRGAGPFKVELRIWRPGTPGEIRAVFSWARS